MEPRRFVTAFTRAHLLSPCWTTTNQSTSLTLFLKCLLEYYCPSTSMSSKWSLSLKLPHQKTVCLCPPYVRHAPPIPFFLIWSPNSIRWTVQITRLLIIQSRTVPCYLVPFWPKYLDTSSLFESLINIRRYRPVFLNRRAAARYRALTSIIPGRERFSWKVSFSFSKHFS